MAKEKKRFEILLVEDNPGDIRLIQEVLKNSDFVSNLAVVFNGEEALDYLMRRNQFTDVRYPDLILLDLNLPRLSGLEVLEEIKKAEGVEHIPVIVLTSSDASMDVTKAYKMHANAYITKPVDYEQYVKVISYVEKFWFSLVKLPHNK